MADGIGCSTTALRSEPALSTWIASPVPLSRPGGPSIEPAGGGGTTWIIPLPAWAVGLIGMTDSNPCKRRQAGSLTRGEARERESSPPKACAYCQFHTTAASFHPLPLGLANHSSVLLPSKPSLSSSSPSRPHLNLLNVLLHPVANPNATSITIAHTPCHPRPLLPHTKTPPTSLSTRQPPPRETCTESPTNKQA